MPATIVASDNFHPGDERHSIDRTQNDVFWVALNDPSTNDQMRFYYSTDGGLNWTEDVAGRATGMGAGGTYRFFIDINDYAHILYTEGITPFKLMYRRGTPNASRTGWTWSSEVAITAAIEIAGGLVVHVEGSGWIVHVLSHVQSTDVLNHRTLTIASDGTPGTPSSAANIGTGNSGPGASDLDFRHTGDGKTAHGTPNLYAAWSQTGGAGIFFKKASYSAGVWTWGTQRTIQTTPASSQLVALAFDGTRVLITHSDTTASVIDVNERDEADTTTTSRTPTALADGSVGSLGISYRNDDIYVVAIGATSLDPKWIRYNRGGGTWGSWTTIETGSAVASGRLVTSRGVNVLVAYQMDSTPDLTRFEAISVTHRGSMTLQGVASFSPQAKLAIASSAVFQGVAQLVPSARMQLRASAVFQGVGRMTMDSELTPFLDFTVFDGYLFGGDMVETFGLIYFEGEGFRNTEELQPLRPPRQDMGNEPTEVRPESGEIFSQQDFSNGAGQLYFHHEGRDVRRFLWSEGFDVDIDTVGRPATLQHLHDVPAPAYASANAGEIIIFDDLPFLVDGTTFRRGNGDFPGFWTADDPHAGEGTTTVHHGVASGEHLYAALGANGIHRRDTAGAWEHWNDLEATSVAWVMNRIIATDGESIYEVLDDGVTPDPIETLPVGWTFQDIFEVSGFVYAVATSGDSALSRIHAYGTNQAGSAIEKKSETPFPHDQVILSGEGYLDTAFLGGGIRTPAGGYDPVVYQALVVDRDRGALSYSKLTEGEGAGAIDLSVLAFEPVGENVLCGWSLGSGFPFGARDGLALYKLKNGAFFPHLKVSGAGAGRQIRSIASYKGRILFTVRGAGLYYEEPTKYVSSAYLVSSVADWNTTAEKSWDTIEMSHNPLPAGTSVAIDYTTELPTEDEWVTAMSHAVEGEDLDEVRFSTLTSRLLAVRIRSTASSSQLLAPSGHGFLVRSNLLPDDAEWVLTRYIRILKRDRKDTGGEDVFIESTHTRKRDIQLLAHRWVTLYEPGVIWTARVARLANITPLIPKFEETSGEERQEAFVMQLTLEGVRD